MFSYIPSIKSNVVRPCTAELFRQTVNAPRVASICAEISDALEKVNRGETSREDFETFKANQKKLLPAFTFHATFRNERRRNREAIPTGFSMYDKDHVADPTACYKERVADRVKDLGIVLAHITPSGEGLRLVFIIPKGMDLEQAQLWMSQQLQDPDYDGCVKDLARCSFAVPNNYILYEDDIQLFCKGLPQAPVAAPVAPSAPAAPVAPSVPSAPVAPSVAPSCSSPLDTGDYQAPVTAPVAPSEVPSYHGLPASTIIAKYWELNNAGNEPTSGDRNTLTFDLACSLRHIFGFDRAVLNRVIPNYDGFPEKEKMQCIDSALSQPRRYMPTKLKKVLDALMPQAVNAETAATAADNDADNDQLPPAMPDVLPPLVDLLVSRTPAIYRPAVAHAIFPALGIYPDQTKVSIEETVCIRFNWNASTTIIKGQRYFHKVLTDGPISRINFCTIPERPIGAEMPIYGEYDALFDKQLQTYIQNLKQAGKVVDSPEAYELAKVLDRENKDYAIKTQSRVFENLSFRANVIAYLKACLLYIAQGYTWTKVDEDFIRWSLRYDLWCKMHFFGEDIADAERGSNPEGQMKKCRSP